MNKVLLRTASSLIILPYSCLLISLLLAGINILAQENNEPQLQYCKPAVKGLPRGKALVVKYEYIPSYNITTTDKTGSFSNSSNKITRNGRWDIKLKIPVINKPSLSIVAGLKYNTEQYHFSDLSGSPNPLYQSLEDRALNSIGANLLLIKPRRGNTYWILRVSADLNGDYDGSTRSKTDYLKFSVAPAIGWKKNDDLSYAVGISYSYTFGRPLVLPTFAINKNFNDRWGLEAVLPVLIKLRYTKNDNFYWFNGVEVNGASYRLNNTVPSLDNYQPLHLHRSEIRLTSGIERAIKGWLWIGAEAGFRHNLLYNLTNSASGRSGIIFKNKTNDGLLLNASIFLVPPKAFLRRLTE
jgi:Domain of unknown function (DUF6268)